jgi:DNA repair ATPase RecN
MGQNEIANPNVDSSIGIQDELGKEALEQQKVALERELKVFTENKEGLIKGKENYLKQWEVDKRLLELQLEGDNIRPLEPKTKLETMDEYFELVKQMIAFKLRFDTFQAEQQIEGYDKQIEAMEEQIKSAEAELKKLAEE